MDLKFIQELILVLCLVGVSLALFSFVHEMEMKIANEYFYEIGVLYKQHDDYYLKPEFRRAGHPEDGEKR